MSKNIDNTIKATIVKMAAFFFAKINVIWFFQPQNWNCWRSIV